MLYTSRWVMTQWRGKKAYRGLMSELVDLDAITKIRHCANTGLVLGSEKFRKQVTGLD